MVTTPGPGGASDPGCAEMGVRLSPPGQMKRLEDMLYIGLDPGTNTGLAIWDAEAGQFIEICTLSIVAAMSKVRDGYAAVRPVTIVAEDARKRQWLPREKNLSEYRGKLMGAGSIKRDCEIWEEFAALYGIPIQFVPPRKGLTKWDAETFNKMTGWTGRTSNHARDAALV